MRAGVLGVLVLGVYDLVCHDESLPVVKMKLSSAEGSRGMRVQVWL